MGNSQPKIDPKEEIKQNKRTIRKAIRDIERNRTKLQGGEAKILRDIKAMAMKNEHGPAQILAKDLVRQRQMVKRTYIMCSQLKAIEFQLDSAQMNQAMLSSLKGVNGIMSKLNESMNLQDMSQIMKEFAKETAKMEMQGEMMTDQMDMMADPESEVQAEDVYNQILGEIGMSIINGTTVSTKDLANKDKTNAIVDDDL